MAIDDWYRLTVEAHYTDTGTAVQNVYWFQQVSPAPSFGESQFLADDFGDNVISGAGLSYLACLSPAFVIDNIRCQKMGATFEGPVTSVDSPMGLAGTGNDVGVFVPSICCLVYKLTTAMGGRRHRGRIYIGGLAYGRPLIPFAGQTPTLQDHGRWSADCVSHYNSWFDRIFTRYDGTTVLDGTYSAQFKWILFSRALGGSTPPFNIAGVQDITGYSTDGIVRLQRRREFDRGI